MGMLELCVLDEIWKVAVATIPGEMAPKLRPERMQVVLPPPLLHRMLFSAAEAAGPAETVMPVMSVAEYFMLHSKLAGCAPPESLSETLSVTRPPRLPLPELSARPTCCADADTAPMQLKTHAARRIVLSLFPKYLFFSFALNIETPIHVSSEAPILVRPSIHTCFCLGKGPAKQRCGQVDPPNRWRPAPKLGTRILREYPNKTHTPRKAELNTPRRTGLVRTAKKS